MTMTTTTTKIMTTTTRGPCPDVQHKSKEQTMQLTKQVVHPPILGLMATLPGAI